jgi:hypothetical protein
MSNQLILWMLLIVPLLSLFLMKKEDLKRFMPVTLFTAFTSGIMHQILIMTGAWYFREIAFPFVLYGLFPAIAIWIFRFTYGRFGRYMLTNAIIDLVWAFVIVPWFNKIGLIGTGTWTTLIIYLVSLGHACLLYGYQIWQETIFAHTERVKT